MSNYEKLKELAEATKGWDNLKSCWPEETEDGDLEVNWFVGAVTEDDDKYPVLEVNTAQYDALEDAGRLARYYAAANPSAVLALIADLDEARNGMKHSCAIRLKKRIELLETQRDQLIADNERLTKAVGLQVIRRFVGDDDQKNIDELVAAGIQVDKELIVQLKAENERLEVEVKRMTSIAYAAHGAFRMETMAERDHLKAEVAGLKTGYEAYERVNAELKAELEALRKRIDDMSPFKGAPFTGPDLKCLACGGYHYGLSGLPCPKFRNTAQSDLPETRSGQIGAPMGKGEQS